MTLQITKPSLETAETARDLLSRMSESTNEELETFFDSFDENYKKEEAAIILINAVCYHANLIRKEEEPVCQ